MSNRSRHRRYSEVQTAPLLEGPQIARSVQEREYGHLLLQYRVDEPIAPDDQFANIRGVAFWEHPTTLAKAI